MKRAVVVIGLLVVPLAVVGAVVRTRAPAGPDRRLAAVRAGIGTRSADAALSELVRDFPNSAEAQFLAARQARLAGRWDDAAKHLDRAAALGWSRNRIERERLLGLAASDFPKARPALEQMLAADPEDRDVLLALGDGELRAGHAKRAAELAEQVLRQTPGDDAALLLRGSVWQQARRFDLARADLEAVVNRGPDSVAYPPARSALAACLLDLGEFDAALTLFRAAAAEGPGNPVALFGVGRAASYVGRLDEARRAFEAVLALRPGHVETLLSLAQVCEQLDDPARAVAYLEEAEKGDPDRAEIHSRLAKLLTLVGQEQRAAGHEARYREISARQLRQAAEAPEPGGPGEPVSPVKGSK